MEDWKLNDEQKRLAPSWKIRLKDVSKLRVNTHTDETWSKGGKRTPGKMWEPRKPAKILQNTLKREKERVTCLLCVLHEDASRINAHQHRQQHTQRQVSHYTPSIE